MSLMNHSHCVRKVPHLFQWFIEVEHLHDSLRIDFIWLRLPLAAGLQESGDGRNHGHSALESLEGNTESHS